MKNILREEKRPLLNKIFVGGTRKNSTPKGLGPLQRRLCDWWRWLRSASAGLVLSVSVVSLLSFTSTIADDYYIIGGGGRGVGQSGQYGGYGGYIGSGDSQYADSGYANKNKDGGGAFVGPKTYYGDSSYNGQGYCATNTSLNEQFNGSEGSGGGDGGKGGSVVATDGHPFSMTLPSVAGKLYIGGGCGGSANTGAGGAGGAGGDVLLDAGDIRHSGNITVTAGNGGTGGNSAANESSVGGAGGKVSLEANSIEAAGIIITAGDGNYAGRYAGGAGGDVSLTAGDIRTTTGGITVGAGKGGKDSSAAAGSAGGNVSLEAGDIITTSDFILTAGEGGEGSYGNSGAGGNISLEANAVTAP
ncbi:MAG: hypothetical protein LBT70_04045, partial [Holosporaceae bacterium]|nr:hypothetical protein [Holosporaceae bacterium]